MQMNAGSLAGQFGEEVESFTKRLLEANFFSLASSDAHNVEGRNFKVLVKAYEIAKDILSTENADKLFKINTNRAVKGNPIEPDSVNEEILNRSWFSGILDSIKNFRIKSE
jgi:protein-tyrosine phosphatase